MKNVIKISVMIVALVLIGCKKIDASKGTKEDHQVDLTTFTAVDLGIPGEMTFTQSATTSINVNCSEKVFKALDIYVKDNQLYFDLKKGFIIQNGEEIDITVTAPDINALSLSGSGIMHAHFDTSEVITNLNLTLSGSGNMMTHMVKASQIKATISGSGNLSSDIVADKVQSTISGSGLINFEGTSTSSDITISGSGAFNGFDLTTDDTDITISSSGLAEVHTLNNLTVHISGSGSVFYKGTPGITSTGSGSGALINAN